MFTILFLNDFLTVRMTTAMKNVETIWRGIACNFNAHVKWSRKQMRMFTSNGIQIKCVSQKLFETCKSTTYKKWLRFRREWKYWDISYKDAFSKRDATHKCSRGSNTLSEKLHILILCENTAHQLLATGQTVFIRITQ